MWKVDLWKSEKEQSVHLYEANEMPREKRKSGKGVVEICMNIFDRTNREWFPTVSSHSRTGVYQKKLNGRTKKGREDAFSRILQFSCGTSCCSFLWLGKVYWVQKYLDKFTRVKYTKRFNKKKYNILAQEVSEPQIFWSWSTWRSQTEPGSMGKWPHISIDGGTVHVKSGYIMKDEWRNSCNP